MTPFAIGHVGAAKIVVHMTRDREEQLARTCFRADPCAGNFRIAERFTALHQAMHREFNGAVTKAIKTFLRQPSNGTRPPRFQKQLKLDCLRPIGWERTAPLADFTPDDLEHFRLSATTSALAVKLGAGRPAALTSLIAIDLTLCFEEKSPTWNVHVDAVYPGRHFGLLEGDISAREGIAFFHPDHPGERP